MRRYIAAVVVVTLASGCSGSATTPFSPSSSLSPQSSQKVATLSPAPRFCSLAPATTFSLPTGLFAIGAVVGSSASDAWLSAGGAAGNGNIAIYHFNGSAWSASTLPTVPGESTWVASYLWGLDEVAPNNVWAGGTGITESAGLSTRHPILFHWNGSTWASVSNVFPDGYEIDDIKSDSPDDVWAVADLSQSLKLAHWNGSSWHVVVTSDQPTDVPTLLPFGPNDVVISTIDNNFVQHWNGLTLQRWPLAWTGPRPAVDIWTIAGTSDKDFYVLGTGFLEQHTGHFSDLLLPANEPPDGFLRNIVELRPGYVVLSGYTHDYTADTTLVYNGVDRVYVTQDPFPPGDIEWTASAVPNSTSFWTSYLTQDAFGPEGAALDVCPTNPPSKVSV